MSIEDRETDALAENSTYQRYSGYEKFNVQASDSYAAQRRRENEAMAILRGKRAEGRDVPSARARVLDAARDAVLRDRAATHGNIEDSFGRIAALWSAHLGAHVSPLDVPMMMALLKVARARGNPRHEDNFVDLAGYAACAAEIAAGVRLAHPHSEDAGQPWSGQDSGAEGGL